MRLKLLRMVNFTWFTTFPIFCHQSISFLEKSQKFSFLSRGYISYFWSFPTFSNCFTPMWLEMTHNGKFGQKSGIDWVKMAIFAYFSIFFLKMRLRLTQIGQFHLIHNFSHLLPPKHLIFGEISKIFISGGGTSANFLRFPTFQIVSHQCGWKWPTMAIWPKSGAILTQSKPLFGQICHCGWKWPTMANLAKKWLRLGQNGQFCIFFYLFPKMRLKLLRMAHFTWFTTFPIFCHQSISFLEKSQKFSFLGRGVHRLFFGVFQLFQLFHTNAAGNDPQWQIWPKSGAILTQSKPLFGQICHCGWKWPTMANLANKVA